MLRQALLSAAAAALLILPTAADAQRGRPPVAQRDPVRAEASAPSARQDGIIRWNTPNAQGNFGGPSAGGGAGSSP